MEPAPFATDEEALALLAAFEAGTLTRPEFTHRAHLLVGLWYLDHHPLAEARRLVPDAIKAFNAIVGTSPSPRGGYHETITQFYLTVIDRFRATWQGSPSLAERANALYARYGARDLLLRHYPEEDLWSAEARVRWIPSKIDPVE